MASSKHKGFLRRKSNSKPDVVVSSLRKENAYLKRTLVELSRQHSEHYKLIERFLALEAAWLENCQQPPARDEQAALPPEQPSKKGESLTDADPESDERPPTTGTTELQNQLADALEKNKQWLEYDQQREAYVRAIMARMLWLERQLNEANQARSQQHKEDHSDEKEQMRQMQEHYERLLQKAKDELQVLRGQVDIAHQGQIMTQNECEEREVEELEELEEEQEREKTSRKSAHGDCHCSEAEEQELRDEAGDLKCKVNEEKRGSASFELQANLFRKFMLDRHHADQEKMADLERQIKISAQDLEDEKQNCSYLKKQMVRVLKMLQKPKGRVTNQSKRDEQDSCEETHPPPQLSRDGPISSSRRSLLNESFLECPSCRAGYPASHYRELMDHLETCLN